MNVAELLDSYKIKREECLRLEGQKSLLENNLKVNITKLQTLNKDKEINEKALILLQNLSKERFTKSVYFIENLITEAIKKIYSPDLEFKLDISEKRDVITVDFTIFNKTIGTALDLNKSYGGGIGIIVACVLRILLLELARPKIPGFILLDESGRSLSSGHQEVFGQFLRFLSDKLDRQVILVSHQPKVVSSASRVVKSTIVAGVSKVELVEVTK